MDWQQDAPLIAAGISKAAGQDVRTLPYLHWWSFLAWFDAIGEGSFATVVAIRDKLRRGKRLENWELDYYRTAPWWSCGAWRAQRNRRRKGGCWNCWGDEKCRR